MSWSSSPCRDDRREPPLYFPSAAQHWAQEGGQIRLVANTIKHSDGSSSRRLAAMVPELFRRPDSDWRFPVTLDRRLFSLRSVKSSLSHQPASPTTADGCDHSGLP